MGRLGHRSVSDRRPWPTHRDTTSIHLAVENCG